tara:strand:- start:489 stop:1208 length:720 start_codon:yes stop_codon:yes gene_type:complete
MAGRGCSITVQLDHPRRDLNLTVALHAPLYVLKQQLARASNIRESNQVIILLDLSDPMRNSDVMLEPECDRFSLREIGICEGSTLSLHFIRAPSALASRASSMGAAADGKMQKRSSSNPSSSGGGSSASAAATPPRGGGRSSSGGGGGSSEEEVEWLPEPASPQTWWRTRPVPPLSAEEQWAEARRVFLASISTSHVLSTVTHPRRADHSYNGVLFDITNTSAYVIEVTAIHMAVRLFR